MLDLIFYAGIVMAAVVHAELLLWTDRYFPKVKLRIVTPLCLREGLIYACPGRLMDPTGIWNALWDLCPGTVGNSLDVQIKNYFVSLWNTIDVHHSLTPSMPLLSLSSMVYLEI